MQKEYSNFTQISVAVLAVILVAAISYPFSEWIGYRSVALILLLVVSILAMRLSLTAVLIAAVISALVWDFFFIPPHFTFTVSSGEDVLLIIMYFIVALLNGIINYRVRQFEQMKSQSDARAEALELYGTLFSALSHELRTPIATIIGAADTLEESNALLSETQKKILVSEITDASLRLSEQVENLLNMSRLEAGVIRAKKEWTDVADLIFNAQESLKKEGIEHPLTVHIQEDMPLVQLDFGLTIQCIHNLLSNVYRHTPAGTEVSIKATILQDISGHFILNEALPDQVESVGDGRFYRLSIEIADTGQGFPPNEIKHAFEKFYRYKQHKADGTGLGLFIVKGFIAAQGGEISLHNQASGGAKFIIELPTLILPQAAHHGA